MARIVKRTLMEPKAYIIEGKEQWLADKYGPRADAAKSKLMPLMEKCADHEGIATVFDSIE